MGKKIHTTLRLQGVCNSVCILSLGLWGTSAYAAPPSQEEMWQIIQQQQREIQALKDKLEQAEARPASRASQESPAKGEKVEELERETGILAQEVEKLKTQMVIPEEPKYKSMYGLGPAASKVYGISKGLSLGGYG